MSPRPVRQSFTAAVIHAQSCCLPPGQSRKKTPSSQRLPLFSGHPYFSVYLL